MSTDLHRLIGLFVLLVAGTLLALAARNLPARLLAMPGDGLREVVLFNDDFSESDFLAFVASRENAIAWRPTAEYLDDLSVAYAARGAQSDVSNAARELLYEKSMQAQMASLRLEAADPYGWSQLAFLNLQKPGHAGEAAAALRLSILSAPYEPALLASRHAMAEALRMPDSAPIVP